MGFLKNMFTRGAEKLKSPMPAGASKIAINRHPIENLVHDAGSISARQGVVTVPREVARMSPKKGFVFGAGYDSMSSPRGVGVSGINSSRAVREPTLPTGSPKPMGGPMGAPPPKLNMPAPSIGYRHEMRGGVNPSKLGAPGVREVAGVTATNPGKPFRYSKEDAVHMSSRVNTKRGNWTGPLAMPKPSIVFKPKALDMPKPSMPTPTVTPNVTRPSQSFVEGLSAPVQLGAAMAGMSLIGAGAAYMTGGDVLKGAMAGSAFGMGSMAGVYSSVRLGQMGVKGFSSDVGKMMTGFHSVRQRQAMVGGGAMLGGMMFSGNRSHASGFNKNRGNHVGR